ncbi:MAG: glycosyltransferase family 2 protein [Opitutaceae bacterium]
MPPRSHGCAPPVSILLPVHNAAGTLARAVGSIRRQTFSDWELLAVDDGSTDGSRAVLEDLARADPRVRVFVQPHGGIVAALNAGLAAAGGDLIARMDADDESHPERLAEQVRFLESNPDIGLAGCLVEYGGDRTANAGYALHVDWLNALVTPEQIALNRFVESPFAHPSVMLRRELVERHGGYHDGDFPEDYELWLRWLDAGVRMAKVPRPLLTWHDPPGRLSRTDPRYDTEAFYRLKAEYLAKAVARNRRERPLLVWGAGRPTRKRAAYLEAHGLRIAGYIDIDPKKTGRSLGRRRVMAPDELPPPGEIFILGYVAKRGARELIRERLTLRGHVEGRDFLMGA